MLLFRNIVFYSKRICFCSNNILSFQRSVQDSSDSSDHEEQTNQTSTSGDHVTDDTFDIVTYKEHDQISLVDGDDKPFLHGRVVDPEPVVPDLKGYSEGTVVQSHWILVMCPKVVQGWVNGIVIDDDKHAILRLVV